MNEFREICTRMDDLDVLGFVVFLTLLVVSLLIVIVASPIRKRRLREARRNATRNGRVKPLVIHVSPDISVGELLYQLKVTELVLSNDRSTGHVVLHRRKRQ